MLFHAVFSRSRYLKDVIKEENQFFFSFYAMICSYNSKTLCSFA